MKQQLLVSAFTLIILLFWTCCKDEICNDPTNRACPNFDPCTLVVPANGGFAIMDSIRFTDTIFAEVMDTILSVSKPYFRANDSKNMGNYTWKIGDDARIFTAPSFELLFEGFEGDVEVQLTTTVEDPQDCLASDELIASSTQSFYVTNVGTYNTSKWGTYKGSNIGNETKVYTVTFEGWVSSIFDSGYLYGISLPDDCEAGELGIPLGTGYDIFVSEFVNRNTSRRCRNLTVIGRLSDDNRDEVKVDYWYDADDGTRQHELFIGYRE